MLLSEFVTAFPATYRKSRRYKIMSNIKEGKQSPLPDEKSPRDPTREACIEGDIIEVGPNLPKMKLRLAQFIVVYLIVNITFIIIFTALSIGDYSTRINFDFATIPFQSQFLLIGLVFIILSLFIIVYGVLYRHGRNAVLKSLYGKCKPPPTPHEYLLFNVIIKGFIGCVLVTFAGVMIELIVLILSAISPALRFAGLTFNQQMLLFWVLLFTSVCLYLLASFIWKNGYRYFIHRLIQINANIRSHAALNDRRIKFAWAIYGVVFGALVVCIIGLYVMITEGIFAGQGWNAFVLAPWELQIAWVGICGIFVTGFMIMVMMINRRTISWVENALFIRPISKAGPGKGTSTRLASISLFLGIFLIFVGAIMWGFTIIIEDIFGIQITQFLTNYTESTVGYILFMWGFIFFISTVIALILIFFFTNGYTYLMKQVGRAEEKVETKIEGISLRKPHDSKVKDDESKVPSQQPKHGHQPYIKPGQELSEELSHQLKAFVDQDAHLVQEPTKAPTKQAQLPSKVISSSPKPATPTPSKAAPESTKVPAQTPKSTAQAPTKTTQEPTKAPAPKLQPTNEEKPSSAQNPK